MFLAQTCIRSHFFRRFRKAFLIGCIGEPVDRYYRYSFFHRILGFKKRGIPDAPVMLRYRNKYRLLFLVMLRYRNKYRLLFLVMLRYRNKYQLTFSVMLRYRNKYRLLFSVMLRYRNKYQLLFSVMLIYRNN